MKIQLVTKRIFAMLLLFVSIIFFPLHGGASNHETIPSRHLAQNFNLPDLNGDVTQLSDYRGSVVVLLFWTTW